MVIYDNSTTPARQCVDEASMIQESGICLMGDRRYGCTGFMRFYSQPLFPPGLHSNYVPHKHLRLKFGIETLNFNQAFNDLWDKRYYSEK